MMIKTVTWQAPKISMVKSPHITKMQVVVNKMNPTGMEINASSVNYQCISILTH